MNKVILALLALFLMGCGSDSTTADLSFEGRLAERKKAISDVLMAETPVLRLVDKSEKDRFSAQELFIKNKNVKQSYNDPVKGEKVLNEIFSVSKVRPSDISQLKGKCKDGECFRVEMYNYAMNMAIIGVANIRTNQLFGLNFYRGIQPDVPPKLVDLAIDIAKHNPKVIESYGDGVKSSEPLMPATKTSLNKSKCERSNHLCVAPTFVKGEKALWAIVDLTDLDVVGVKWTNVGGKVFALTEKRYQNDNIMSCYCDKETSVDKGGWRFSYSLTRSDGLRISQVKYKGKPMFNDVKLVDWHVSYSKTEGFGYSDAVGCPEYSQAAVLAVEPPFITPMVEDGDTTGFVLTQKYFSEGWPKPCNYNYQQNYEFYHDGRFRPLAVSLGRGCGMDGTYRPVTRVSIAGSDNSVGQWNESGFKTWQKESWSLQDERTKLSKENYWFEVKDKDNAGFYIEANKGQYNSRELSDHAFVYFTKRHIDRGEGEEDLPTIGPCCNTDYHQGPEKYIGNQPESIVNSELVFWYVPQIENDGRTGHEYCWAESLVQNGVYVAKEYPCYMGPMFVPIHL